MSNKTKLAVLGLVIVTSILLIGVSRVSAQTPSPPSFTQQFNTMVDTIAHKLGLTSGQVKSVFEEARNEKQAQWLSLFEERLVQAVAEGVLTQSQKQGLLAKQKELLTKRNSQFAQMQNLTPAERRTAMENDRTELETWAKEKGISLTVLRGLGVGFGGHRGFKMGFGMDHHF